MWTDLDTDEQLPTPPPRQRQRKVQVEAILEENSGGQASDDVAYLNPEPVALEPASSAREIHNPTTSTLVDSQGAPRASSNESTECNFGVGDEQSRSITDYTELPPTYFDNSGKPPRYNVACDSFEDDDEIWTRAALSQQTDSQLEEGNFANFRTPITLKMPTFIYSYHFD